MDDGTEITVSSLAITEKKAQRPGGCVGIFFQLFDWNRRFAKKKLFPKKLLPFARAKQDSKKFGGDDKLPKLRLIADENSGGFPNLKKNGARVVDSEHKNGMRAPGLVARLMGLESMPTVQQVKLMKVSSSEIGVDRGERFGGDYCGFGKEGRNLEKGCTKHELRPQKLQKTGLFERRPVTRFGAEALQFKNILSRSRKNHPKLASPVKSPKSRSGRNVSPLIDAATKILEPGLLARNRAKCALTYSKNVHHAPTDEVMLEATTTLSPDLSKNSDYYVSAANPLKGQSSCRNCGNLLDGMDASPNIEERRPVFVSSVSNHVNRSSQGSERTKAISPMSSLEQQREQVFQKGQEHLASIAAQATDNIRLRAERISDKTPLDRECQIQWHLASQQCRGQKDSSVSIFPKHKAQRQSQVLSARDRIPPRLKLSNLQGDSVASPKNAINETQNFVAMNRNFSGRTWSRMPAKVDNFKFDTGRKFGNRRDDSLSPMRKKRSMNVSRQGEGSGFVSSNVDKQRNISCNAMTAKGMGCKYHSVNRTCMESRFAHLGESNRTGGSSNMDNDVSSFTFSSRMKQKGGLAEMEKIRDQNDYICTSTPQKNSISDGNRRKTWYQKPFPLRGDTLGVLEQNLKELTCQEDEVALRGTPPKRTSAVILQELISALTSEGPYLTNDVAFRSNAENSSCYCGHVSSTNTNITFQAKPMTAGASDRYSHDNDHLSPGSVLEASFSNDSCFSSSLDDSSRHKLNADSMDCSYAEPQPLEPELDLLDSATSLSEGRTVRELVTDLLHHISEVLCSIDLTDTRLKGSKLTHAKQVIVNAELVLGHAVLRNSDGIQDFSISRFLLDELETLANVMWTNFSFFLGFKDTNEGNLLKGFLFDCVVEYLDASYGQFSKSGFKAWTRLPLCLNSDMLIRDVVEEFRRWMDLAGLIPDELIEREMSCCSGKWTDFGIEAFEIRAQIDGDILQILVDEIVIDLWERSLGSSGIVCSLG